MDTASVGPTTGGQRGAAWRVSGVAEERADLPSADPALDQYFLTSTVKLGLLIAAAGIRPSDDVVEFGAGAGTVAAEVPRCRSLTLVEFDSRLVDHLTPQFPHATVRQGDALEFVDTVHFDVLLSNLPWHVTDELTPRLIDVPFLTAVLAVDPALDLDTVTHDFDAEHLAVLDREDFTPPQPVTSHLIRLSRREQSHRSGSDRARQYGDVPPWARVGRRS